MQILSISLGVSLLYLFSPPLLLVQALLALAIEPPVSLAKLEAMATAIVAFSNCSTLEPRLHYFVAPSTSLPPAYSLSSFYLMQLLYYTTT